MNISKNQKLVFLATSLLIICFGLLFNNRVSQISSEQNNLLENNQTNQQLAASLNSTLNKRNWDNLDSLNCKSEGDNLEHSQALIELKAKIVNLNFENSKVTFSDDSQIILDGIIETKTNKTTNLMFGVGKKDIILSNENSKFNFISCFKVIL